MDEIEQKVAKLPAWARDHIRDLKIRSEPNVEEMVRLRARIAHLEKIERRQRDRIEAMVSMFQCAAKGGNEVAEAVQKIVEDFLLDDAE